MGPSKGHRLPAVEGGNPFRGLNGVLIFIFRCPLHRIASACISSAPHCICFSMASDCLHFHLPASRCIFPCICLHFAASESHCISVLMSSYCILLVSESRCSSHCMAHIACMSPTRGGSFPCLSPSVGCASLGALKLLLIILNS